ncbi:MAG: hypothetical protein WCB10_11350 [Steroidobacteraceae bacterium]
MKWRLRQASRPDPVFRRISGFRSLNGGFWKWRQATTRQLEPLVAAKFTRNMVCFPEICRSFKIRAMQPEMSRQVTIALYLVAMAAVIVGVDFAFFRNRFWERLTVNIGIVLVFAAFYFRFLRR